MPVISVENVSVCFVTGDIKDIGMKEFILKKIKKDYHVNRFWANKDITFQLNKGDMLGIIGKNGAGKSTLLKAISGVLIPTRGTIRTKGKIAALLELTAGFDNKLTVKENTFLRGALLGYTKEYMKEMYDQIIHFAELEEFQDRQFGQLSSGMKSRLAFSIACLISPDILILDEVLSVGDGAFREKSGNKMREILANGVTGILVSHSVEQVRELCNKILWLDHGNQVFFGNDVECLCNAYEEFLHCKQLPKDQEDLERLSESWFVRKEQEQQIKLLKRKENLKKELSKGSSEAVLLAALDIVRKQRPEMLREPIIR